MNIFIVTANGESDMNIRVRFNSETHIDKSKKFQFLFQTWEVLY